MDNSQLIDSLKTVLVEAFPEWRIIRAAPPTRVVDNLPAIWLHVVNERESFGAQSMPGLHAFFDVTVRFNIYMLRPPRQVGDDSTLETFERGVEEAHKLLTETIENRLQAQLVTDYSVSELVLSSLQNVSLLNSQTQGAEGVVRLSVYDRVFKILKPRRG